MREELDFGEPLNRPSVHMTGFKEIFLLKARRASVEETRSYADELVGCDFELLELPAEASGRLRRRRMQRTPRPTHTQQEHVHPAPAMLSLSPAAK